MFKTCITVTQLSCCTNYWCSIFCFFFFSIYISGAQFIIGFYCWQTSFVGKLKKANNLFGWQKWAWVAFCIRQYNQKLNIFFFLQQNAFPISLCRQKSHTHVQSDLWKYLVTQNNISFYYCSGGLNIFNRIRIRN